MCHVEFENLPTSGSLSVQRLSKKMHQVDWNSVSVLRPVLPLHQIASISLGGRPLLDAFGRFDRQMPRLGVLGALQDTFGVSSYKR